MWVRFKGRFERGEKEAAMFFIRIIAVTERCLEYEADRRRADILMSAIGICDRSEGLVVP